MEKETQRKLLVIPVIIVGVVIFLGLVKNRAQPEKTPLAETARAVRIIEAPRIDVVPTLRGTGTVQPSQVWNGVAQVSGKIIHMHQQFKRGAVIQEGEAVLKIDPSDYELAIAKAQTNINAAEAQLAENKVKLNNAKSSLKIEQDALRIAQEELERKRALVAQGTVTRSDFEKEERNVLAQQQSVQSLKNTINLLPAERQRLQADIERLNAQLKEAELNLQRTTVIMPFTGRIAESNVEIQQFVRQGDRLVVADGISKAEVEVDLSMERLAALIQTNKIINVEDVREVAIGEVLGLSARVYLQRNGIGNTWEGKIVRTSDTMDPRTRTVGFIVEVPNPYKDVQPGVKPPLVKGMFVEVEIRGTAMADKLVLPRSALDNQYVYIADAYNRLERRAVQFKPGGANFVIVESGLKAGERVVISDLSPAITGMLLEPVTDKETLATLIYEASAGTAVLADSKDQPL